MEEERKRKAKLLLVLLVGVVIMTNVNASWIYLHSIQDDFTAEVYGGGNPNMTITVYFDDIYLDTSNGADSEDTLMEFELNQSRNLTVSIIDDITDLTGGICPDYEDDCELTINSSAGELIHGTSPLFPAGTNEIIATLDCVKYSCEQEHYIAVELTRLG